jgi:hypothetical protein
VERERLQKVLATLLVVGLLFCVWYYLQWLSKDYPLWLIWSCPPGSGNLLPNGQINISNCAGMSPAIQFLAMIAPVVGTMGIVELVGYARKVEREAKVKEVKVKVG